MALDVALIDRSVGAKKLRVSEFDGLRGIAVLAVVLHHMTGSNIGRFPGGALGVDVFFVLSGYLITLILKNEFLKTGKISFAQFYKRRFFRLMPALWLVLIFVAIYGVWVSSARGDVYREVLSSFFYITDIVRTYDWYPMPILGHTWSLSVEEQFYIFWPVILVFALRQSVDVAARVSILLFVAAMGWGIILCLSGMASSRIYSAVDVRAGQIFLGCALAFTDREGRLVHLATKFWYVPCALFVVSLVLFNVSTGVVVVMGFATTSILSGWLILSVLGKSPLSLVLCNTALVYIGRTSYGIYLWHHVLLQIVATHIHTNSRVEHYVVVLVAGAVSIGIAAISYRWIEKPLIEYASIRKSGPVESSLTS